jgi:hypothetical protein
MEYLLPPINAYFQRLLKFLSSSPFHVRHIFMHFLHSVNKHTNNGRSCLFVLSLEPLDRFGWNFVQEVYSKSCWILSFWSWLTHYNLCFTWNSNHFSAICKTTQCHNPTRPQPIHFLRFLRNRSLYKNSVNDEKYIQYISGFTCNCYLKRIFYMLCL